jgi:hypothetical protein
MPLKVKHSFTSLIADAGDSTKLQPKDWNADHQIIGSLDYSEITGTPPDSGSTPVDFLKVIYDHLASNADPIEFVDTTIAGYVILGWFTSAVGTTWVSATTAVYNIPSGKTLLPVLILPAVVMANYGGRKMRCRNTTDGADFIADIYLAPGNATNFAGTIIWQGDVANPSALLSLAGPKTIKLEKWSSDANKRAVAVAIVFKEV